MNERKEMKNRIPKHTFGLSQPFYLDNGFWVYLFFCERAFFALAEPHRA